MADLPPNSTPDGAEPDHASDASTDSPPARRPLPRAARLSRLTSPTDTSPAGIERPVSAPAPVVPAPVMPTPAPPVAAPSTPAPSLPSLPPAATPPPAVTPPLTSLTSSGPSIADLADLVERVRADGSPAVPTVRADAAPPTLAPILPPTTSQPPAANPAVSNPPVSGPPAAAPLPVAPTPAQRPATAQSRAADPISRPTVQLVELVAADTSTPSPAVAAAQQAAATAAARPHEPVLFKPIDEVMATRSVILSGIGIVLCFFPVLSLAGLLMGVLAQRRIQRSNGALTGRGSARWGILLGAIGLVLGATADMVFLLRR